MSPSMRVSSLALRTKYRGGRCRGLFVFIALLLAAAGTAEDLCAQDAPFAVNIGTLPPGKRVTVQFDAVVRDRPAPGTVQMQVTGSVQGSNAGRISLPAAQLDIDHALIGRAHFLWNTFLGMTNIVAVSNPGRNPLQTGVQVFDEQGRLLSVVFAEIAGFGQHDFPINDFPGVRPSQLGLVRIDFSAPVSGSGLYYRRTEDGEQRLLMGHAFENALQGENFALFNTYQPEAGLPGAAPLLANWLQLANLEGTPQMFRITLFDEQGNVLQDGVLELGPLARKDVAAGHEHPGAARVGLVKISPADLQSRYAAQIGRYAVDNSDLEAVRFPFFGNLSGGRQGSAAEQWIAVSTMASADNWLAIANTQALPAAVELQIKTASGDELQSRMLELSPYSQQHLFLNEVLPAESTGITRLRPLQGSRIIAEAAYFFRTPALRVSAAYSAEAQGTLGALNSLSYNTYLGQFNWLKLFNTAAQTRWITLTVHGPAGPIGSTTLMLPAGTGRDVGLHQLGFPLPPETYGMAVLETADSRSIYGELLRTTPTVRGQITSAQSFAIR